ncbi:EAL domain-containing protein [Caenispirillum bisanense]|uniref:PAS domain S-box-containing protein/diguanylate cyclase (GGDEF) domain-containing protein n=1 Tax=Caenispirillum bisanense TaxID=414052 RepID=A0A286GLZ9_9PROT|nr:EAL domain-containing protein [Caenispirillum bisanense]SOD96540.1 PAS domain S-box-containing protein/diguanylate cyclase (GGDEF) domain-containing protein [Caenispirillum bisanense]
MTPGRVAIQIVGALLVGALTVFFLQSRVDTALPREAAAEVQAFSQRDATLNRDLVLARYGYLAHVDPLVEHLRALYAHAGRLDSLADGLDTPWRDEARAAVADLRRELARKDDHIEAFKSANAVLHASLAYFPTAVEEILAELDTTRLTSPRRMAAERAAGALLRAVLDDTRPGPEPLSDAVAEARRQLGTAAQGGSALLDQTLATAFAHLDMITAQKASLDSHLRAATGVAIEAPARRVDASYAAAFAAAGERATLFRGLLFGTAVLLVLYVAAVLARLRVKAAALSRSNADLRQEMASRAAAETQLAITGKVFDSAVEGVIVADAEGRIVSVNPAFTAITGVLPGDAVGRHWGTLTRASRADQDFPGIWRTARQEGRWQGEVWNTRPDGSEYAIMLTVTMIEDWDGRPRNYVALFHDVTDAKASAEELHFRTYHDALTGLPNRAMVKNRLAMAIGLRKPDETVALALFDLDNFRTFNDGLGHAVGDALIREVGERLSAVVDVETHTVGRLGADEFALVLRGFTDVQQTVAVLRRAYQDLARPLHLEGHELYTSASVGVAVHPTDGLDAEALFKNADVALARAKEAGGNTFQFYTQDMEAAVFRRLTLEADLRRGLKRHEFALAYQPKVCARTGQVVGLEALVRWLPAGRPMVSPAEFIPVAEQTGLIVPLGAWILQEATTFAEGLRRQGFADLTVAVNLSARQFRERTLIDDVAAALGRSGLPAANLELEITESMVMDDAEQSIATLRRLKGMGLRVAVDDFGTGYSSLSYLKRFPLDALKIDQGFVRDLTSEADDRAIVAAIISLARSLGLKVVAEGVETQAHFDYLRAGGCDQLQGYLLSRPLMGDDITAFLHRHREGWQPDPASAATTPWAARAATGEQGALA